MILQHCVAFDERSHLDCNRACAGIVQFFQFLQHGGDTAGNIGLTFIEVFCFRLHSKHSFILGARNVADSSLRGSFLPHAAWTRVTNRNCDNAIEDCTWNCLCFIAEPQCQLVGIDIHHCSSIDNIRCPQCVSLLQKFVLVQPELYDLADGFTAMIVVLSWQIGAEGDCQSVIELVRRQ